VIIPQKGDTPWPAHPGSPIHLTQVDSTNEEALRRAAIQPTKSLLLSADCQTAGKGQRGHKWESDPGLNLLCTWLIDGSDLPSSSAFLLNMAVACALCDTGTQWLGYRSKIKWPNDLWCLPQGIENEGEMGSDEMMKGMPSHSSKEKYGPKPGAKWGGILIENQISGAVFRQSAIGFGLNINQTLFGQHLPLVTSLKSQTGCEVNRDEVLQRAILQIQSWVGKIKRNEPRQLVTAYLDRLLGRGEFCNFFLNGKEIRARIDDIDATTGALILFDGQHTLRGKHPVLRHAAASHAAASPAADLHAANVHDSILTPPGCAPNP
jgi:BirA family biotin operon repressor/biotin-[acetyl-CoA-carboxylase] ligase